LLVIDFGRMGASSALNTRESVKKMALKILN